ncbi:hypothetical protein ANCDUO_14881, partial [Ancylostoma duodenale]
MKMMSPKSVSRGHLLFRTSTLAQPWTATTEALALARRRPTFALATSDILEKIAKTNCSHAPVFTCRPRLQLCVTRRATATGEGFASGRPPHSPASATSDSLDVAARELF